MDRIEEWRLFVAVARLASFSRAAKAHGCSPQAATRAVAAIEERVGVRLLHRTTRSVALTADGERYLERSRRAIAEVDALETRADARAPLRGVVSVTAPVLYGQLHVAGVVYDFMKRYDEVDVRLSLVDRVVSLSDEAIDVAFRIGAPPDSALRSRMVGQVRSVVCASPSYLERMGVPAAPEALQSHAVVAFGATTPIANRWAFPVAGSPRRAVTVRPRVIVNDGRAAIDAAIAGLGLVRVLSYQVDEAVRRGKLKLVLEAFEPKALPVHVLQLPGISSRAAAAFVEHAVEKLTVRSVRAGVAR
jgi:DNA-binding transcriptional LysR family regulator